MVYYSGPPCVTRPRQRSHAVAGPCLRPYSSTGLKAKKSSCKLPPEHGRPSAQHGRPSASAPSKPAGERLKPSGVGESRTALRGPSSGSLTFKRSHTAGLRQSHRSDSSGRRPQIEASHGSKPNPAGKFTSKEAGNAWVVHGTAADDLSSRERQKIGDSFRKMMVVACVIGGVLVITASVLAYALLYPGRKAGILGYFSGTDILRDLAGACDTDDCKRSLALINASLDPTANPCVDMYRLACGQWHNQSGGNMTYDESVLQTYVSLMHSGLVGSAEEAAGAPGLCRSSQPQAKMGCVYASCLAFSTKRSTTLPELWAAAGIDSKGWMAARDVASLFAMAVRTALISRLASAFRVIKISDTTAQVDVGTCIACSSTESGFAPFLIDQLADSLTGVSVRPLSSSFLKLDSTLKNVVRTPPTGTSLNKVGLDELDVPKHGVSWSRALAQSDAFGHGHGAIQLVSANPLAAKLFMNQLIDANLEVIKLYFLAVPVAPFLALEHKAVLRRTSRKTSSAQALCLDDTHALFRESFDKVSAIVLDSEKASVAFRAMWNAIRLSAAKSLRIAKGIELDQKELMESTFEEHGGVHVVDQGVFSANYGDSFLANLILYQGRTQSELNLTVFQTGTEPQGDSVPRSHFLPDFYYSGATETAVNYGTLGVLVASMLFEKSFPKDLQKPSQYIDCLEEYVRDALRLSFDKEAWRRYTQARWSVDAAFAALEGEDYMYGLDELFYLRFARTYCGEPESSVRVMKYALLASKHFASVFGCSQPKAMEC